MLKLEVGKTYVNTKGQKVRIICTDGKTEVCGDSSFPCIGLIGLDGGLERVETYKSDGYCGESTFNHFNLLREYKPPVTYTQVLAWVVHRVNQTYHPDHKPFVIGYNSSNKLHNWAEKYGYTILKEWVETFTDNQ